MQTFAVIILSTLLALAYANQDSISRDEFDEVMTKLKALETANKINNERMRALEKVANSSKNYAFFYFMN